MSARIRTCVVFLLLATGLFGAACQREQATPPAKEQPAALAEAELSKEASPSADAEPARPDETKLLAALDTSIPLPERWAMFRGDGFDIGFPRMPTIDPARWMIDASTGRKQMDGVMYIAGDPDRANTSYGVTATTLLRELQGPDLAPELLAGAKAQLLERLQGTLLSERRLPRERGAELELFFDGQGAQGPGWRYAVRLLVQDARLLQLMVTFPTATMGDGEVMKDAELFFDSLRLHD